MKVYDTLYRVCRSTFLCLYTAGIRSHASKRAASMPVCFVQESQVRLRLIQLFTSSSHAIQGFSDDKATQ